MIQPFGTAGTGVRSTRPGLTAIRLFKESTYGDPDPVALRRRLEPTTMTGTSRALRHVVERVAPNEGRGPDDDSVPLARNVIAALERLERMVGA